MGICAFCDEKLIVCNGVAWIYGWLEGGSICHGYMCILLYVKLIWCSGIPHIYDWLEEGGQLIWWVKVIWKCKNVNMTWHSTPLGHQMPLLNSCSVVVFHRSMVKWGVHLPWVDVHSAIMWNLFGAVVFHTSMINWRGSSSDGYRSCEHVRMSRQPYVELLLATRCLMLNSCSVVVFQKSIVKWGDIFPG